MDALSGYRLARAEISLQDQQARCRQPTAEPGRAANSTVVGKRLRHFSAEASRNPSRGEPAPAVRHRVRQQPLPPRGRGLLAGLAVLLASSRGQGAVRHRRGPDTPGCRVGARGNNNSAEILHCQQ
jgi:hypothetical protein